MPINSYLLKSLRKNRNTVIETPGKTQYLRGAITYARDFESKDGREFTRLYIRGTDAISGVPVSNVELHCDNEIAFSTNVVLLKRHVRELKDKDTGRIVATYQHAMSFEVIEDETLFEELTLAAENSLEDGDDNGIEVAPQSVC